MNPKGLETDPPLAPEWLGSKSKDNPGGGGTGVGGKPFSGLINHAWEDADGKGGGRRSDERVKDLDRWGVKGGSLLADNLPKNGFGASVKLRDDDRAIGVPPGRPIVRREHDARWTNDQGFRGQNDFFSVSSERWTVDPGRGGRGKVFPDNTRRAGDREDRWGSLRDDGGAAARKWISPTDHGPGVLEQGDERWNNDTGRLGRGRGHGGLGFGNAAFAHGPGHNESLPGGDAGWSRTSTTFRGRGRGVDHEKWHPSVVGGTLTEKIERVQVPKQPSFCYSKNKMVNVYMALKNSNRLILPEAVDRSDPSLFADEDQPDVLQVLVGQHKPGPGGDQQHPGSDQAAVVASVVGPPLDEQALGEFAPRVEPKEPANSSTTPLSGAVDQHAVQAHVAGPAEKPDQWYYLDPSNNEQGPFPKSDIIEWKEQGYFFDELKVRNANDKEYSCLQDLLKAWGHASAPPGFDAHPATSAPDASPATAEAPSEPIPASSARAILPETLSPFEPSPLQSKLSASLPDTDATPGSALFYGLSSASTAAEVQAQPKSTPSLSPWFRETPGPAAEQAARVQTGFDVAAPGPYDQNLKEGFPGQLFSGTAGRHLGAGPDTQQGRGPNSDQLHEQQLPSMTTELFRPPPQLQLPHMNAYRFEAPDAPQHFSSNEQFHQFPGVLHPNHYLAPHVGNMHEFGDPSQLPQPQPSFRFQPPAGQQQMSATSSTLFQGPEAGLSHGPFGLGPQGGGEFNSAAMGGAPSHVPFLQQGSQAFGRPPPYPPGRQPFYEKEVLQPRGSGLAPNLAMFLPPEQGHQQQPGHPFPHQQPGSHRSSLDGPTAPAQAESLFRPMGMGLPTPGAVSDLRQPPANIWENVPGALFLQQTPGAAPPARPSSFFAADASIGPMLEEHALPPALLEDARDARNRESHGAESALGLPQRTSLWSGTGMTASPLTPEPTRAHAGGQPEPAEPWGSAPPFQEQVKSRLPFKLPHEMVQMGHQHAPHASGFDQKGAQEPVQSQPSPMKLSNTFGLPEYLLPKEAPHSALHPSPGKAVQVSAPAEAEHSELLFPVKKSLPAAASTPAATEDQGQAFQKVAPKKSRKPALLKDEPPSVLPDEVLPPQPPPWLSPPQPQGKIQVVDADPRALQDPPEPPRQYFAEAAAPPPQPQPEMRPAWSAAVQTKHVVKTLAEIQEEEARAAAAAAEAAAPSATGTWAKALGKPSGASGPAWGIVSEADPDQRLRTGREILGPLGEPVAPQGITLGDALGIRAPEPPAQSSVKKAPWADLASQKATQVTSLRDIQFATAQVSRLEQEQQRGAAVKATPALPRAAPAPAPATAPAPVIQGPPKPAKTAKEIQEEHKMHLEKARAELKAPKGIPAKPGQPLVQARVPPPKIPPQAPETVFPEPENDDDMMFWDYGQGGSVGRGATLVQSAAANRLPPPQSGDAGAGATNGRAQHTFSEPSTLGHEGPGNGGAAEPANDFGIKLSPDFERWCRMELKRLTGKEDMDVVFCCMALESNSEVADAIHNVAQGSSANQFIAEFIKRKQAELKGGRRHKQSAVETPRVPIHVPQPPPVTIVQQATDSWQKIPKKQGKGSKAKKGEKVPNELLGFGSGVNYNLLSNHDV